MGARFYDSYLGRWLSPDTLVPDPRNPQSLNRYFYVEGNPLRYWDPTGHSKFTDWLTGVGIKIGNSGGMGKALMVSGAEVVNHLNNQRQDIFFPNENTTALDRLGACTEIGFGVTVAAAPVAYAGSLALGALGGGTALAETGGAAATAACADGDCGNEIRTAYQIGEEGEDLVFKFLNDPTLQREVKVYVNEAGKRANYFARLDGLTETAIHEVKNVANLSLSQDFMDQAQRYKLFADSMGVELHYWLINSAPQNLVDWLNQLGVTVHTSVP